MDLGTLIRILLRRWYVVLPLLAITLITAVQIGRSIDPDYQARGSVLLIGPNISQGDEVNPLAELRSPLNTTALAIGLIAVDEQTRTEVRQLGFQGTYEVDVTPNTPIINIRVRATTPEQALLTLEAVIDAVKLKLDERQRGVDAPEDSLIQGETLTKTTTSRALYGSRDRAVAGIMAVGLVAAASAAVLFEAYVVAPARREEDEDEDPNKVAPIRSDDDEASTAERRRGRRSRTSQADAKKSADQTASGSGDQDEPSSPSRWQARSERRRRSQALKQSQKESAKAAKTAKKNIKKNAKEAQKEVDSLSTLTRSERRRARRAKRVDQASVDGEADELLDSADELADETEPPENAAEG